MMHDPLQAYATLGSYGISPQIGLHNPYLQTSAMNPITALNPLLGLSSISQFGAVPQMGLAGQGFINPQQLQQQLQLASLLAQQQGYVNPVLASILSNPILAATLHSQLGGFGGSPFGGIQPQLGQIGALGQIGGQGGQFGGYPLAPQSWIGQGGMFGGGQGLLGQGFGQGLLGQVPGFGQSFGQVHPLLSQLTQRQVTPWGY